MIAGGFLVLGASAPALADVTADVTAPGPTGSVAAADVIRADVSKNSRVPFTDANTGAVRLPLVGGLPLVGSMLPDGSNTLESARPFLENDEDDKDGLAGLPLGGTAVAPADLLPTVSVSGSPAPGASPYSSTAPRPGIASPSAAVPSASVPSASVPSAEAPATVAPSSAAPASMAPSAAPSVEPSEAPYQKADDPRLLEEPIEDLTAR